MFHALFFPQRDRHISIMTSSKDKPPFSQTDAESSISGFAEAPQPSLSGTPFSASIADWAKEISDAAEQDAAAKPAKKTAKKAVKKADSAKVNAARTSRGTSIGTAATAKERAAAGLNPVSGLDVALEDADKVSSSGATATVQALSDLIESGNPLFKNGELWTPHRPVRPA